MRNQTFIKAGIIAGVLMILCSLYLWFGAGNEDLIGPFDISSQYKSGVANFNGDFQSYVNNNAAAATSFLRFACWDLEGIYNLIGKACGIFLFAFGSFTVCLLGSCLEQEPSEKKLDHAMKTEADVDEESNNEAFVMPEAPNEKKEEKQRPQEQ